MPKRKNLASEIRDGADADEVSKWLRKGRASVADRLEKTGATPLMLAAHGGSRSVAKILLENGADIAAADRLGDTALHYLNHKQKRHAKKVKVLLTLLEAKGARGVLNTPNRRGVTPIVGLHGLVSMARTMAADKSEARRAADAQQLLNAMDGVAGGSLPSEEKNDRAAWADKMGEAFAEDSMEFGAGRVFETDLHREHATEAGDHEAAGAESDEAYRRRIVTEMKKRKRPRPTATAADDDDDTGPGVEQRRKLATERDRLAEEMKAREQQKREETQRIVAEQVAETARLQSARAGADYETAAAAFFDAKVVGDRKPVGISKVPFPGAAEAEVRRAILGGITDPEARRKRLKNEQRRWHPDRWSGQMMAWVVEADRAAVQDRVLETSKMINGLAEDEKAKEAQAATT